MQERADANLWRAIQDIKFLWSKFMTPLNIEDSSDGSLLKISRSIQLFMKALIERVPVSLKYNSGTLI